MRIDRKLLRVEGADRAKFLNDLITISVEDDMPLRYGALLSPQGKLISDLFIHSDRNALFIDIPSSQYDTIKQKLNMYRLRASVELSDDERPVYQCEGTGDPRGTVGARVYNEDNTLLSNDEYTNLRISALVPEFGRDFDTNEIYPIEWRFNEMGGIDYRKGCYVGQEIAARMRHKTELQKTLLRFAVDGDTVEGAPIMAKSENGEREIGRLLSHAGGQALGFVRLKWLNGELSAGGARLTQLP